MPSPFIVYHYEADVKYSPRDFRSTSFLDYVLRLSEAFIKSDPVECIDDSLPTVSQDMAAVSSRFVDDGDCIGTKRPSATVLGNSEAWLRTRTDPNMCIEDRVADTFAAIMDYFENEEKVLIWTEYMLKFASTA